MKLTVAVAAGDTLRLRWLLNSLEEQTVGDEALETLVIHRGQGITEAALRLVTTSHVVFLSPECRPPSDWLKRVIALAEAHPGAIVQGKVISDPDEWRVKLSPRWEAITTEPPDLEAELDNSVWPMETLRRLHGGGKRTEAQREGLLRRAAQMTPGLVSAPELVMYSRPVSLSLLDSLKRSVREGHPVGVRGRMPASRAELALVAVRLPARILLTAAGLAGRARMLIGAGGRAAGGGGSGTK